MTPAMAAGITDHVFPLFSTSSSRLGVPHPVKAFISHISHMAYELRYQKRRFHANNSTCVARPARAVQRDPVRILPRGLPGTYLPPLIPLLDSITPAAPSLRCCPQLRAINLLRLQFHGEINITQPVDLRPEVGPKDDDLRDFGKEI